MNTKINSIAQEMCNIKASFDKIYSLMDEEKEALEAFELFSQMMMKLGEGYALQIINAVK